MFIPMDLDAVRRSLEPTVHEIVPDACLPARFFDSFILRGLRVDLNEPGRIICSFTVPPRFVDSRGFLHGGMVATMVDVLGSAVLYREDSPTSGVSLEISVSIIDLAVQDEEIEIEAKVLSSAKYLGVCTVELRKKKTRKVMAHGRHTKYLPVTSKL